MLFPCSSVGSHPRETVLHKFHYCGSFPWVSVLHELLQCGWGILLQEETVPVWCPYKVTGASTWGLHGLQPLSGLIYLLCHGVLHGLQGDNLHHYGLHHGLQGNLCSRAWTTSSPSFFTDLGVCKVVCLTCILTSLSQLLLGSIFFLFLNMSSHMSLISSALASDRFVLELAGTGSTTYRGNLYCFLTEVTLVATHH